MTKPAPAPINPKKEEPKEDLRITDEEVSTVKEVFTKDFKPFSIENGLLFKDFDHPYWGIPDAFVKLTKAVEGFRGHPKRLIRNQYYNALKGYMTDSRKKPVGFSPVWFEAGIEELVKILGQKEEIVREILTYYRLYKTLYYAKRISGSSEISL